jgi:long-chain acyl-CoA synthetase
MTNTVAAHFLRTSTNLADRVALRWRSGDEFSEWTWAEYADRACRVAAGLRGVGLNRGERVLLMLRNQPEFHIADMGTVLAGGTPVSAYSSLAPGQIAYLANDCGATVAVITAEFLDRFTAALPDLPLLRHVVVVGDTADFVGNRTASSLEDLLGHEPLDLKLAAAHVGPDDLATVIYTSGTTGHPKGVMVRHRNVCASLENWLGAMGTSMQGWRVISYLPMAHVAERTLFSHYMHVVEGSEVTTCPDPVQFGEYLTVVRPDFAYCPPRLLEKMHEGIWAGLAGDHAGQSALTETLELGRKLLALRVAGSEPDEALVEAWKRSEDKVIAPIRDRLGLDRCRILLTGAAPISPEIFEFYSVLGLPLSECYGLSECTGGATWTPTAPRAGTVGKALPGVELRLLEDGEILLRGANVVSGYLNKPEATAETFDADGWLHTGDVGVLDDGGYLKIVDRKKDLIITSGGQNIAPSALEGALKGMSLISQACVVGDGRRYVAALIVLDTIAAKAVANGVDLATDEAVLAAVQREVDEVNAQFARVEQIKRFHVLTEEWLPGSDELTPTMKLRRREIHTKYAALIDSLYEALP